MKDIVIRQEHDIMLLKMHCTNLTARSLCENLLFHNLPETSETKAEKCEATVRTALNKLGMRPNDDLQIEHIHPLGQYNRRQKFPRPVVANLPFKQCEVILDQARKLPKMQEIRITHQFPNNTGKDTPGYGK